MNIEIHWIPATVVVLYLIALFAVTWWARRLTQHSHGGIVGYLLAGRQLPFWVGAALLAGLAVGGVSTVGAAEWAFDKGISAGWYNAAWAAAALVVGVGAAKRYRRLEITTLPEFFELHYGTTARVLGVIGQLLIQIVITSLQYVAGGAIRRRKENEVQIGQWRQDERGRAHRAQHQKSESDNARCHRQPAHGVLRTRLSRGCGRGDISFRLEFRVGSTVASRPAIPARIE